jgi:thioredoxin 1
VQSNEQIRVVQQKDWDGYVSNSTLPVFVEFWAPWCGPCRTMAPLIAAVAREHADRANFVKVNVDETPEIVARFQIFSVPTFIVFVKGEPMKRFVGMATKNYMANMLKSCLEKGRR